MKSNKQFLVRFKSKNQLNEESKQCKVQRKKEHLKKESLSEALEKNPVLDKSKETRRIKANLGKRVLKVIIPDRNQSLNSKKGLNMKKILNMIIVKKAKAASKNSDQYTQVGSSETVQSH